jgi:gamma-glutamyltranspeptidase
VGSVETVRSRNGVVTSPHHLASESGAEILRQGGNAIEAALAMAATLTVVYPHMNTIGGDGFWLIADETGALRGLAGAGQAGRGYSAQMYLEQGFKRIPERGPLAINTVAGIVGLWHSAHEYSRVQWKGRFSWKRLLEDAVGYAERGFPLSQDQCEVLHERRREIEKQHGFADTFIAPLSRTEPGAVFRQLALARTLKQLQSEGGESFYRGPRAERGWKLVVG